MRFCLFFTGTLAAAAIVFSGCSKSANNNPATDTGPMSSMDVPETPHDTGRPPPPADANLDSGPDTGADDAADMTDLGPPIDAGPCGFPSDSGLYICDTQNQNQDCSGCSPTTACVASSSTARYGTCVELCPSQCDSTRGNMDCMQCPTGRACVPMVNEYGMKLRFGTCG
jgi:hypothetical protein